MLETAYEAVKRNCSPTDFIHGLYDGAIVEPVNAAAKLINESSDVHLGSLKAAALPSKPTLASRAGALCGFGLDLGLIAAGVGGPVSSIMQETGAEDFTSAAQAAKLGTAGFVYGGIFQNTDDKNFWVGGAKNALTLGGSLAAIGATGPAIAGRFAGLGDFGKLGAVFTSGTIGGATGSILDSTLNDRKIDPGTVLWQSLKMGAVAPLFAVGDSEVGAVLRPEPEDFRLIEPVLHVPDSEASNSLISEGVPFRNVTSIQLGGPLFESNLPKYPLEFKVSNNLDATDLLSDPHEYELPSLRPWVNAKPQLPIEISWGLPPEFDANSPPPTAGDK